MKIRKFKDLIMNFCEDIESVSSLNYVIDLMNKKSC